MVYVCPCRQEIMFIITVWFSYSKCKPFVILRKREREREKSRGLLFAKPMELGISRHLSESTKTAMCGVCGEAHASAYTAPTTCSPWFFLQWIFRLQEQKKITLKSIQQSPSDFPTSTHPHCYGWIRIGDLAEAASVTFHKQFRPISLKNKKIKKILKRRRRRRSHCGSSPFSEASVCDSKGG